MTTVAHALETINFHGSDYELHDPITPSRENIAELQALGAVGLGGLVAIRYVDKRGNFAEWQQPRRSDAPVGTTTEYTPVPPVVGTVEITDTPAYYTLNPLEGTTATRTILAFDTTPEADQYLLQPATPIEIVE